MGFDHVLTAPLFAPGALGDVFLTGNHERAHSALGKPASADDVFGNFVETCRGHDLQLLVDIVLGCVAADAEIVRTAAGWFHPVEAATPIDPRSPAWRRQAANARFDEPAVAEDLAEWWIERLRRLLAVGIAGFRCQDPRCVPQNVWRHIISAIQRTFPESRFLAWTPGLDWRAIADLKHLGFTAAFSSAPWWNGRASWFIEEYELLRGLGPVIASPEAPFGPRLARRIEDSTNLEATYRHILCRAAATGSGLMVPMGFEFASNNDMDSRHSSPEDLAAAQADCKLELASEIRAANAIAEKLATLGINGEMRALTGPGQPVTMLLRSNSADVRNARAPVVVIINPDLRNEQTVPIGLDPLPPMAGADLVKAQTLSGDRTSDAALTAGEVRILCARRSTPVRLRNRQAQLSKIGRSIPRIAIERVAPTVDGGRYAAKRVVGEIVVIEADVFMDGHEVLSAELQWRAADEGDWRRARMQPLANDRWRATIAPSRVGRHEFTVEAWWDTYGTLCRDLEIKRAAGMDVRLEIAEGRQLLAQAQERGSADFGRILNSLLDRLADASVDTAVDILLASDLRDMMRDEDDRPFRYRHEPAFPIEIERPQAAFGAWYELFPRSASNVPGHHGTFEDVIRRLPAIRDMGFDVLYLPPIHPIGTTNRKGPNNSLRAEPEDVGSPYAIGNSEGGHDAIHAALGTIDDFRRLREAAATNGLEIALDFAIQCSPDHPWLSEHPGWFTWRPDGSLRYAENPPKIYEDIVNVDFYQKDAIPALWLGLRDVILHWVNEGVRIFRVDNPHTKPFPFWEWAIAQVKELFPDVIFLSEAFTRPKLMYHLAKLGFSQSYTYFTWRNTKQELIDYLVELTTTDVKDYFRPHFFVSTPDINPYFLQTSGRPGFLIRSALAATLSGLWGMYSGFELCEAAALPGREEYLNSEKYEIRIRSFDTPGNITAEIAKLNRIRRTHPALQSHLGLRFYPALNDQIIYYGKPLPAHEYMILVAVNLDPFHAQEATIEVPLWEWGLPDSATVTVEDLMHDTTFAWHGKLQRIRLDPNDLPFAVWRIAPGPGG